MITVIDLKMGNVGSVCRALDHLKIPYALTGDAKDISAATKLIFPGVGSFCEASRRLLESGLGAVIRKKVLEDKTPILGICLGMQLLATNGEEHGHSDGLDLIKGEIKLHRASQSGLELPHIGWNDVSYDKDFGLFSGIEQDTCFYFVHSYEFIPLETTVCAYSDYGVKFVAAIKKGHIIGVQFHPEKSQKPGLKILANYYRGIY